MRFRETVFAEAFELANLAADRAFVTRVLYAERLLEGLWLLTTLAHTDGEPFAFFDRKRARASLDILGRLNDQISQIWVIAQEFEDDSGFELHLECARDADELSVEVMGVGG